jgi:hypothetical protein
MLATVLLNIQLDTKDKLQPEDVWKLPNDIIPLKKIDLPTREEMSAIADRYRKDKKTKKV